RHEPAVVVADERCLQALAVLHVVPGELSLDAERPLVRRAVHRRLDRDDALALGHDVDRAADAAVRTDRPRLRQLARQVDRAQRLTVGDRAGRAGLDALAAERAGRVVEQRIELGGDLRVEAAVRDADRVIPLPLGADAHAAVARDAQIVVAQDEWIDVLGLAAPRGPALEALATD